MAYLPPKFDVSAAYKAHPLPTVPSSRDSQQKEWTVRRDRGGITSPPKPWGPVPGKRWSNAHPCDPDCAGPKTRYRIERAFPPTTLDRQLRLTVSTDSGLVSRLSGLFPAACLASALLCLTPGSSAAGNAPSDTSHSNRLAGETSPYLLLHAHNPVDWYPWGRRRSPGRGARTCRSFSRSGTAPVTGAT